VQAQKLALSNQYFFGLFILCHIIHHLKRKMTDQTQVDRGMGNPVKLVFKGFPKNAI
jgi:hypothetical protein